MKIVENNRQYKLVATAITAIAYIVWLCIYLWCKDRSSVSATEITVVSVVGTIIVAVFVLMWWKLMGQLFNIMNVFLAFFVAFNFGQCLLWSVGIHTEREIGERLVFNTLDADNLLILQAQLIFIICFITFNCGAFLIWNQKRCMHIEPLRSSGSEQDMRYRYLFYTAFLLSLVVIPVTLYNATYRFILGQTYGYGALYHGEAREFVSNPIINIITSLFCSCLLGLLIGSHYNKRVRIIVYGVFLVFAVITLLGGDRGEWINMFIFLFWAEFYFYKKRSGKYLAITVLVGILALFVINAIVSMRNTGLSWEGFVAALTANNSNPIVSVLTEFGHSMGISMLLIAYSITSPYGNTYLMSIPTVFSTGVYNTLFGAEYVQIHTWFPDFLGINYGTDFSIIGEAILNYGVYVAPFVLLVEGVIIGWITQTPYRRGRSPLGLCFSISSMIYIVKISRSTLWLVFNGVIYLFVIMGAIYWVIKYLLRSGGELEKRGYCEKIEAFFQHPLAMIKILASSVFHRIKKNKS